MAATIEAVDFDTRYKKLNSRQKEAVNAIDGPLMVVAGPGTGKTELLSMRTANILKTTDTLPGNILCLTFTESGAAAMRQRLSEIIGADAYKVAIHTFHSFGSEVINQNSEYFYQGASFRPASNLHTYELLRSIFDTLDFSNPLAGKMNDEYTHLNDTLTVISELKKSGLTNEELLQVLDANESVLDAVESDIAKVFSNRVSSKTAVLLAPVASKLASMPTQSMPPGIPPLANVLALSIAHALDNASDSDSTKLITAWKNRYFEKNSQGNLVFKDRRRTAKLRSLSYIYYQYLIGMQEAELYDFDDMVLRVVHAMEVFPDLRYNLQEKYLYIMVDEFQDTNLAQARILHNLTSIASGDTPNIMVVGDDDQAIYSFQGAEVGNILNFRDRYEDVSIVTLTDNYRSADVILEQASGIIRQGNERLERYIEEVDKSLTAHRSVKEAEVTLAEYETVEDERHALAVSIKEKIDSGVSPESIAVLARRHHELVAILPYLAEQEIAVNYERRDNVLNSEVVEQLFLLARIVDSLHVGEIASADALLPQLLCHPAWGIDTASIWQLSLSAYKNRGCWLEQMATMPEFVPLHTWLVETARLVAAEPAEHVIDILTGIPDESESAFISPLYNYFFTEENRTARLDEYITHLEALRSIRAELREYRPGQQLLLRDFIEFIDLHNRLGHSINSLRVRSESMPSAINLLTGHKSKGLEFDHVYIVGAVDSAWGEQVRSRSRLIGYPDNLPISPSGDSIDERLRLFFVAMTRARNTLTISYSLTDTNGRSTLPASFLANDKWSPVTHKRTATTQSISQQLQQEWYHSYVSVEQPAMKELLAHTLSSYKLSVTHLTSFLDVTRGGPQHFLLNNLLRFPKSKHPSAEYGSAIHEALQRAHSHLLATGMAKPLEDVLQDFEQILTGYNMTQHDQKMYLQRGTNSLNAFLTAKYDTFNEDQKVELSFASQQSKVGEATLTGALDLVDLDTSAKTMIVTDYKTGAPSSKWQGKTDNEKLKLHKYRQQLLFYKLMCENSRDYSNYKVTTGVLQFVEPDMAGDIHTLQLELDASELDRLSRLINAVWKRIIDCDFPDTSQYDSSYKGVLAFEDHLLEEK